MCINIGNLKAIRSVKQLIPISQAEVYLQQVLSVKSWMIVLSSKKKQFINFEKFQNKFHQSFWCNCKHASSKLSHNCRLLASVGLMLNMKCFARIPPHEIVSVVRVNDLVPINQLSVVPYWTPVINSNRFYYSIVVHSKLNSVFALTRAEINLRAAIKQEKLWCSCQVSYVFDD